jgi:hypothetical protein
MLFKYFSSTFRLRTSLEHAVLDFVTGMLRFRHSCMQVDVFARLLTGEFDCSDLLFYKYARSVTKLCKAQCTFGQCTDLSKKIFGQEQKQMHRALVQTLESEIAAVGAVPDPSVLVDTQFFVYLLVWVFHHQRLHLDGHEPFPPLSPPTPSHLRQADIFLSPGEKLARSVGNFKPDMLAGSGEDAELDEMIDSIRHYRRAASEIVSANRSRISEENLFASPVHRPPLFPAHPQSPSEEEQESLEAVISDSLLASCRRFARDEAHAKLLWRKCDEVMRKVTENDFAGWRATGGTDEIFRSMIDLMNKLQNQTDERKLKRCIAEFCEAVANNTVALIHQH